MQAMEDMLTSFYAQIAADEFPLIAEYIPLVEQAVTTGTWRVYGPYWAKVVREWGHRRVSEPAALEISQLAEQVRAGAVQRRNAAEGAAPPST
ncbi:MAG TPA: hypothetical protein VKU77_23610 [Streptosporangiaceae bacterium]|nr:hypothetical protein [Streptosporangiaceae bacterium]